mgnify:CR=1 FL=1
MKSWVDENYDNIVQWASNICKSDPLQEDLAHYAIETFMNHKRYDEIIERDIEDPSYGHCRGFILAIMRNAWYGKKSEFSRYYKLHRADIGHRKRNISDDDFARKIEEQTQFNYDYNKDYIIEAIEGIIEEMEIDTKDLWYKAKLFKLYLLTPNFSKLSRETGIPRTSISNAVEESKEYIRKQLKERGIDYDI